MHHVTLCGKRFPPPHTSKPLTSSFQIGTLDRKMVKRKGKRAIPIVIKIFVQRKKKKFPVMDSFEQIRPGQLT
jgi:hypothetical protein